MGKIEVTYACVHSYDLCFIFLVVCFSIYVKPSLSGEDLFCVFIIALSNSTLSYFFAVEICLKQY